ncbi:MULTISPECIES: zinc-binding dehydrogenase [Burkholderiaceae]|jgi:NADPH2:quinone reductase|uniref:Alcohol dehydrogenase n=1 Tax=Burkholderia pseudomultivorans TaxID=1207504 RepID=A0ABU2E5I1_9BURK|nr:MULTISPECIES: zinc-binding dehydrogenase [Burkholderiaceae]UTP22234.1 zinc-binding dehydrogenase [Burkholderia sp. FXe9]MBR8394872.1 zinc-binding dehydrogenase [Burkholderia cenocepacia]MBR8473547.1 zinc-binding dehydrogenase [Burkholderia cenocepacia]MBR8493261.1 zinc-binding dehydrogenase [Burkholderia cenocepacia]MBX3803492.1 zinc-binding dehydrogenase [Burkholderia cepacia]
MLLPMLAGQGLARHGEILSEIGALVDRGKLRPLLDPARFSLTDVSAAYTHLEKGHAIGKVVIDICP